MPVMKLILDEPAWPELKDTKFMHYKGQIEITPLIGGMQSGATSVAMLLRPENHEPILVETSLPLLTNIVQAMTAHESEIIRAILDARSSPVN